jgi:RNA polymerase sigma factor (sigma-70 family)
MLDPALRAFVEAGDDVEVDRRLEALIEEQAAPLVRRIVARKLAGGGPATSPDDLEDIVSDALLALVSRLQSLRQDPESEAIESLDDYTAVVAYNAFAHYLRGRDPARSRLKNRLRYVLTRGSRFGLWDTPDGLACGLARWRPAPASPAAAENLERLVSDPERWRRWKRKGSSPDDMAATLDAVLPALGGPVELDRLVAAFAALSPAETAATTDAETIPDTTALPLDAALDQRRLTARLWREICDLLPRQRAALLLSLRDGRGAGLLPMFPVTATASIREVAAALEMPASELAALWNTLPLDDRSIAERLGCSRQQVINLRAAARKRLSHRLADREPRANIRAFSTSLEDER